MWPGLWASAFGLPLWRSVGAGSPQVEGEGWGSGWVSGWGLSQQWGPLLWSCLEFHLLPGCPEALGEVISEDRGEAPAPVQPRDQAVVAHPQVSLVICGFLALMRHREVPAFGHQERGHRQCGPARGGGALPMASVLSQLL